MVANCRSTSNFLYHFLLFHCWVVLIECTCFDKILTVYPLLLAQKYIWNKHWLNQLVCLYVSHDFCICLYFCFNNTGAYFRSSSKYNRTTCLLWTSDYCFWIKNNLWACTITRALNTSLHYNVNIGRSLVRVFALLRSGNSIRSDAT